MLEKPILFSGPMVQAILDGRKTMTRRVLKPQPISITGNGKRVYRDEDWKKSWGSPWDSSKDHISELAHEKGDVLWVREAWRTGIEVEHVKPSEIGCTRPVLYEADKTEQGPVDGLEKLATGRFGKLRPGIFMPRWACRIRLRVTDVKVERVRDISRSDAMEEGCPFPNMAPGPDPRDWFGDLWLSINGRGSWADNPWVAAYRFERIT